MYVHHIHAHVLTIYICVIIAVVDVPHVLLLRICFRKNEREDYKPIFQQILTKLNIIKVWKCQLIYIYWSSNTILVISCQNYLTKIDSIAFFVTHIMIFA